MNFNLVFTTANTLYGIDKDPEDLMEIALMGFSLIGNARTKLHKVIALPQGEDNSVELPCDAIYADFDGGIRIESVTYGFEDYQDITNLSLINPGSAIIEHWIEGTKDFKSPFYESGRYAKYEQIGRTLYFKENYGPVCVIYKKLATDSEGLPDLTDAEIRAIATYIAYVCKQKEGWQTNNSTLLQMSQMLRKQWLTMCDQARMPDHISQNEMNEILDSYSNHNRKIYNKAYKPIR